MSLSLDGITVTFGSVTVVDDVSLRVDEGSVLGLVGPSGCGKSTLLRSVAGLVPLEAGTIAWRGDDLTAVPTERRDIGFMFQDHALFTHRTVAENVGFGLRMRGVGWNERRARVDELLHLVGLAGFGDRSVERLSGGEAQRVALARALAPEPRLLLLDEPLASLDRARRDELNDELARLLRDLGQTAIYVTHDQHEAFAIADHVAVMQSGRLERHGTPAEVWADPRSAFVARFVGHERVLHRSTGAYAVRADAVTIGAATTSAAASDLVMEGVVAASRFQGDRHLVDVILSGETWRIWSAVAHPAGSEVTVVIDETRLAPLTD